MTQHLIALRQERGDVVDQMKTILDKAEKAGRDLTESETQTFNDLKAKSDKLAERIERNETVRDLDEYMNQLQGPTPRTGISPQNGGSYSRKRAAVLNKGDKLSPNYNGPSLGDIVVGMVRGTKDPAVQNALQIGVTSDGGFLVPQTLSGQYLDLVRDNSRVFQAGARTVPMDSETLYVAKAASDPTPLFRAEGAAVPESQPAFDRVAFTAKTLAVKTVATVELLEDGIGMEGIIQNSIVQAMSQAIDRAALLGSGTGSDPLGVVSNTNVPIIDLGTNGAALTGYGNLIAAQLKLRESNFIPSAAIMAPREFHTFAGLTDTTGQPLRRPDALGFEFLDTNKIPIDLTHGTADDASLIVVGDFSQLWVGQL